MQANVDTNKRKLIGVVLANGEMVMPTMTPMVKDMGYQHIIKDNGIALCGGDMSYWLEQPGAQAVYQGDKVTIQF